MSKRAGAIAQETRGWILKAAREEFFAHGFEGTSLRRICGAAGVTTGALYFFFQGKDDLFRQVLSQVTDPFQRLMEQHYAGERASAGRDTPEGEDADFQVSALLIDLYFHDQKTWDILVRHQDHPAVRDFLDRFIEVSTEHYLGLLTAAEETTRRPPPDPFAIHQFVHMQVDTMLTLISHGFDRQEMTGHSRTVIRMLRGAFRALLTEEKTGG